MKTLTLAALVAFGLASTALATTTDVLTICINNAQCLTVTDNGAHDSNSIDGTIDFTSAGLTGFGANNTFYGWTITTEVGVTGSGANLTPPPNGSIQPALEVTSLTATCKSGAACGGSALDVFYSDINFDVPAYAGQWTNGYSATISGTYPTSGTATQNAWVDPGNVLNGGSALAASGTSVAIPAVGPFIGSGTAAHTNFAFPGNNSGGSGVTIGGPGINPTGPGSVVSAAYSTTIEDIFTNNGSLSGGGITFSTDGALNGSPVPEPTAIILFGTVVALCTSKLRRRRMS
ncbi:MAG TPA: PEP-CTERM sorting domain-containing protein [Blastocatellia bacterium]|nr:PEP-CTERM sorting domain-containing protein [Blastocatellia bacterium]